MVAETRRTVAFAGASSSARRRRPLTIGALFCLCIGLIASRAVAGTINLELAADTFINSASPSNNNGHSYSIFTGTNGMGGLMRGLVQFTMPAQLQGRVTVSSVQFGLTTQLFPGGNTGTAAIAQLRAISEGWIEGNGFGNTQGTYVVGEACGGGIFGATWDRPNCIGGTFWAAAGATVSASLSGSVSVPASGGTPVVWPSQPGMIGDVQNWIDTPSSNHGWRISTSTEGISGQAQRFVSKEGEAGAPSLVFTYACKPGFQDTGTSCTACSAAATAACVTSSPGNGFPTGNTCVDAGPPSTTYACNCSNPAYAGSGTTSCVDRNECLPNNCGASGDSSAVCMDHVAPATGYDCSCSSGYSFSGGTCLDTNACVSNPCGAGGDSAASCTDQPAPSTGYNCSCSSGYSFSGGIGGTCVDTNACASNPCGSGGDPAAICIDLSAPSTAYECKCSTGYSSNGGTCLDTNGCAVNHCQDNGDSIAVCIDQKAPANGYDCKCNDGFSFDGVSCIGPPPEPVPISGTGLLAALLGALSLSSYAMNAWARSATEPRRRR